MLLLCACACFCCAHAHAHLYAADDVLDAVDVPRLTAHAAEANLEVFPQPL